MKAKNIFKAIALTSLASATIYSCSWDKSTITGGNDGVKDSICYEEQIAPIINSNCAMSGCHDGSSSESGYDFSNYFGVLDVVHPGNPKDSKLIKAVTNSGEDRMPPYPNPPLTEDKVNLISQWIAEGAGYNVDCGYNTLCDTSNVTYSATVQPIIANNCLGCHSNAGSGGGIVLNTYYDVIAQVNNGKLMGAINQQSGYSAMPKNGSKLSSCDILKIQIWIDLGIPNN